MSHVVGPQSATTLGTCRRKVHTTPVHPCRPKVVVSCCCTSSTEGLEIEIEVTTPSDALPGKFLFTMCYMQPEAFVVFFCKSDHGAWVQLCVNEKLTPAPTNNPVSSCSPIARKSSVVGALHFEVCFKERLGSWAWNMLHRWSRGVTFDAEAVPSQNIAYSSSQTTTHGIRPTSPRYFGCNLRPARGRVLREGVESNT